MSAIKESKPQKRKAQIRKVTKKIVLSEMQLEKEQQSFFGHPAIIVQARLSSSRLPGKVLLPLGSSKKSVLSLLLERLLSYFDLSTISIIVATSCEPIDDLIVSEVEKYQGVKIYRGSHQDVLDRYYQACKKFQISHCVRITSDCPFIDPKLIHTGLLGFTLDKGMVYLSNTLERSIPRGFDFEIFSFSALEKAALQAVDFFDREHVTPFLYKDEYKISSIKTEKENALSEWRVTLDTIEDYYFLSLLSEEIEKRFSMKKEPLVEVSALDLIYLLEEHPHWKSINTHVVQKDRANTLCWH